MALLAVVAVFVLVAFLVREVLVGAEERSVVRASLRSLDEYELVDAREHELAVPLPARLVAPLVRWFLAVSRAFLPTGYLDRVRHKLVVAGRPSAEELDRFRAVRLLSVAAVPALFVLVFVVLPISSRLQPVVFAFLGLAALLGPDAQLNRRMAERQHAVRTRLPDILDLLTISVEAGLGFEQALERTVANVPGPLSDEFVRMLGEIRAGASRSEALRSLDARLDVPEVRSFVLALLQADTFGVSVGRILRNQADDMRDKRRQLAQEMAQKAPVKMLIPTVFCVMPALFVVVVGPAVINFLRSPALQ
jgi:tight adherence protein C